MMNRKQAIIAMLVTPFAGYPQEQESKLKTLEFDVSLGTGSAFLIDGSTRKMAMFEIATALPPDSIMLRVTGDQRRVEFTVKEVMDALGGEWLPELTTTHKEPRK